MRVQELIDKLNEVEDKSLIIVLSILTYEGVLNYH